jgi:uncharacterized protein YecT (DUF1311 family)
MRSLINGFAVALLAIAVPAAAMPSGPSPDSGLAGLWRIVGAQQAPWAKPKKLAKADAPLLEYAVEFDDGVVKGPAPLGCAQARYAYGDGPYFGGKLANDKDGAMAKAVHLTRGDTPYRVICGTAVRDYYIDDEADMVMAEGDVIYTLQRPTGMDPEQYKAGFSGPSIDCTKAKITGEKLICIDAKLAQSDQKLGAAWRKFKQSISPESFAGFQTAQRAWIAYEMKSCGGNGPMPEYAGDQGKITDCLGDAFDARAEMFDGLKTERAGALVIEPRVRFHMRGNPDIEESDVYPVMSGGPQAAAFNAFIAKTLKLDKWRMDDKTLFRYGDSDRDIQWHAHRDYYVARFDSRVAMINIGTSDYVGGHDEERDVIPLAWNIEKSKPFTLDDVFEPKSDWKKFVVGYCNKELLRRTRDDGLTDDQTTADLRTTISNNVNWVWDKDHATAMFAISMGGGGPESSYNVDIPYRLLKPYMKPDAPVL